MKIKLLLSLFFALPVYLSALSPTEQRLSNMGMVDVQEMDSTIIVDMMYARADNFVGVVLYEDLNRAYLHPDAATALGHAVEILCRLRPDLRLMVKDAARPMAVQARMRAVVENTDKERYVSDPKNGGGMHNYGVAVDLTLADSFGRELPMGTPVDHLGPEANIDRESQLVANGTITAQERDNRLLLRRVMKEAGFTPLKSEWWHFNLVNRATAIKKYKVID